MLTPMDVLREPPFETVVEHMNIIVSAVERIGPLFEALRDGKGETVKQYCQEIADLEEAADQIKNAVRDHLPRTVKMPVSRRDLLTVVSAQDTISDTCLKIVWLLEVREFTVPEAIRVPLFELVGMVMDTVYKAHTLCGQFGVLAEARFRGPHMEEATGLIHAIESLEAGCDVKERDVLRSLFAAEDEIGPVDTVLWFQIVELISSLADASKKLGNRMRLLLAK